MELATGNLSELHGQLQRLLTLHRQLLEALRVEREALLSADSKRIQDCTSEKEGVLHQISILEQERVRLSRGMGGGELGQIILAAQAVDLKLSDQLQSVRNALQHLIQRIREQNDANRLLVETSIEHVIQMKKNILGEAAPRGGTYSPSGQASHAPSQARLLSTEI